VKCRVIFTLAFLLAMLGSTHSADAVGYFDMFNTTAWITIALIVIVIHITLVSLAYMIGSSFQDEQMKAWSKNEIMQAVFSTIIVASLLGTLAVVGGLSDEFFSGVVDPRGQCSGPDCHNLRNDLEYYPKVNRWAGDGISSWKNDYGIGAIERGAAWQGIGDYLQVKVINGKIVCESANSSMASRCDPKFLIARSYLGVTYEKLSGLLENYMFDYGVYSGLDSFGFSTNMYFFPKIFGITLGGSFPMHGVLLGTLDHMIAFTQKLMMLIKFQESILKFFEFGMASGLIVLGIIFRSIWIFRKVGGLFLAMGIGFMYVLPFMYALGWYTIDIPPLREAGIAKSDIARQIELAEGGGGDIDQVFGEFATSARQSEENMAQLIAVIIVMVAFMAAKVVELVNIQTAAVSAIKLALDIMILVSAISLLVSSAFTTVNGPDQLFTDYENETVGQFDLLSRYALVALAIPLINFYITFAFIRGLSPLLGGDADIPGLSRLL